MIPKRAAAVTVSHLRFGRQPIKSTYLVTKADFVACHNPAYLGKYDMVHDIKPGGIFLLNCGWSMEELERRFTGDGKAYLAKNNIHLYTIDAGAIGKELGLGGRVNTVLQAAFFRLTGIIPEEDALQFMKDAATRAYGAKGDDIVAMNHAAIERGFTDAREVPIPAHWATQRGDFVSFYATGRDPSWSSMSTASRSLPTCKRAMTSPFLPSWDGRTATCRWAPASTKSAASRGKSPPGSRKTASSAISAHWSAPTPSSVPSP